MYVCLTYWTLLRIPDRFPVVRLVSVWTVFLYFWISWIKKVQLKETHLASLQALKSFFYIMLNYFQPHRYMYDKTGHKILELRDGRRHCDVIVLGWNDVLTAWIYWKWNHSDIFKILPSWKGCICLTLPKLFLKRACTFLFRLQFYQKISHCRNPHIRNTSFCGLLIV